MCNASDGFVHILETYMTNVPVQIRKSQYTCMAFRGLHVETVTYLHVIQHTFTLRI
jgi:hypothetical protein